MKRIGEITAVTGGMLEVTFCRPEDCGHCHACEGGQEPAVLKIRGVGNVGDLAAIEMPTGTVVKASLLAYVVPVAGLVAGMLLGGAVTGSDAGTAVGGAVGLLGCLAAVWLTERFRARSAKWQPTLVAVIPRENRDRPKEEP